MEGEQEETTGKEKGTLEGVLLVPYPRHPQYSQKHQRDHNKHISEV